MKPGMHLSIAGWLYRYAICLKDDDEPIDTSTWALRVLTFGSSDGVSTWASSPTACRVLHQVEGMVCPFTGPTMQNMQSGR